MARWVSSHFHHARPASFPHGTYEGWGLGPLPKGTRGGRSLILAASVLRLALGACQSCPPLAHRAELYPEACEWQGCFDDKELKWLILRAPPLCFLHEKKKNPCTPMLAPLILDTLNYHMVLSFWGPDQGDVLLLWHWARQERQP